MSKDSFMRSILYLVGVAILAYLIKQWYSNASMDEMQWMMLPLAKLLDVFLSGSFERLANGEWIHVELKILLVKGCSGMNFFIMSFVGYAIVFDQMLQKFPDSSGHISINSKLISNVNKTIYALLAAWLTTLIVNVARIMLALFFLENSEIVQFTGLTDESAHRLAGLIVYLPALFLQMQMGHCFKSSKSYFIVAGLMIAFLIVIPLLTGNAFNHQETFVRHCIWLISLICIGGVLIATYENKRKERYENNLTLIQK